MNTLRYFTLIICLVASVTSQVNGQKGVVKQADKYFEAEKYDEALKLYNQYKKISKDEDVLYKRGVSNFYTNNLDSAIEDLTQAYSLGIDDKKVYFYVGKAMHAKHDFVNAVKFYKNYLRYVDGDDEKATVVDMIKRCATGINMQYSDQPAFIENLGTSVNSVYDEIRPIQSPTNSNKYYFSANRDDSNGGLRNIDGLKDEIYGKYSMDMYAVELKEGNWTSVNAFHPLLNSSRNDILQDFSSDGNVMYFLKTLYGTTGEMFSDTFAENKDEGAYPKDMQSPLIAKLGDKDLKVFNENTILFSSKRAGGYGGYDIYVAYRIDSLWQEPQNLGPEVNSAYDDVSPFLTKSGKKLFFSSDRLSSMGGFDIFETEYLIESKVWTQAENVGMPINSGSNDLNFSISSDGMVGMFSSDRQESMGGYDIFLAYMKNQITDQLMYTESVDFIKSIEPIESVDSTGAEVIVETIEPAIPIPTAKTREYFNTPLYYGADENIVTPQNMTRLNTIYDLLVIFPETNIMLTCHSMQEGLTEFDLYFSIKRAEKAAEYLINKGIDPQRIQLRGLGYNFPLTQMVINGRTSRLAEKNNRRVDVTFYNTERTNLKIVQDEPVITENLLDEKGKKYNEILRGLSFKIQVATVKQMFKGDVLKKYDEATIEKMAGADTYAYTIGLLNNYSEARILKRKLIRENVLNAKVNVYLDGKLLSRGDVESLQAGYPDLREYIKYELQE